MAWSEPPAVEVVLHAGDAQTMLGAGGMGFGAAYATLDAHAARQKCEPDHELLAAPGTADATTRGAPDCRWG